MSDLTVITAERRDRAGKGAARAARRSGRVPAVIYGGGEVPVSITLGSLELTMLLNQGGFLSTLFSMEVDGMETRAIPRDVQFHPVTDRPMHVDFLRLPEGATISVMVPVNFVDEEESEGLTRGGVLNIVRHEIELDCPADAIPESIEISLAGTDIGDSVHISAVALPAGTSSVISDRDFTIVTIAAPKIEVEPEIEVEGEEGLEGEEGIEGEEGAEEGEEATEEESKE